MFNKIQILLSGRLSVIKTIYLNFRSLPFSQAKKLPILVSARVRIKGCRKGSILIKGDIVPFMITLGFGGSSDLITYNPRSSYLDISESGRLVFKGRAHFAPHFSVLVRNGVMQIGEGFSCNNGCVFSCTKGINIGSNCLFGGGIVVRDSDGHKIYDCLRNGQIINEHISEKEVVIGDRVWICNKCNILKGVVIGNDCILSYGSLLTKSISGDNLLIGGHPAKMIKENIIWER